MNPEIIELRQIVEELRFRLDRFDRTDRFQFERSIEHSGPTLGVFGARPVSQPLSTGETAGASAVNTTNATTFNGNNGSTAYTILDVVKHLKNLGLLKK